MATHVDGPFAEAVSRRIGNWEDLKFAVEHGMGGSDSVAKVEWLIEIIVQFFKDNASLMPEEVEEYISTVLDTEFDTRIEDGSLLELSQELCYYFELFSEGQISKLEAEIASMPETTFHSWKTVFVNPAQNADDAAMQSIVHNIGNVTLKHENEIQPLINGEGDDEEDMEWTMVTKHKRR